MVAQEVPNYLELVIHTLMRLDQRNRQKAPGSTLACIFQDPDVTDVVGASCKNGGLLLVQLLRSR